jgi:hypothetical protein
MMGVSAATILLRVLSRVHVRVTLRVTLRVLSCAGERNANGPRAANGEHRH